MVSSYHNYTKPISRNLCWAIVFQSWTLGHYTVLTYIVKYHVIGKKNYNGDCNIIISQRKKILSDSSGVVLALPTVLEQLDHQHAALSLVPPWLFLLPLVPKAEGILGASSILVLWPFN